MDMKKCISMALLLLIAVVRASADRIDSEFVTFLYNSSNWSEIPAANDVDLVGKTYTSNSATVSFLCSGITTKNNDTFQTSEITNVINIPNTVKGKDVITITAKDGYKIRKVYMNWGGGNVKNLELTLKGFVDASSENPDKTITFKGSEIGTLLTNGIESSDASYFSKVTLYKGINTNNASPLFALQSFTIEYVQTTSDETLLDELSASASTATDATVQLGRTLSSSYWNTFCVPFDIDESTVTSIFGSGNVKSFGAYDAANSTIKMEDAASISAGTPYLVKPAEDVVNPEFSNVTISSTDAPAAQTLKDADGNDTGVSVQGTYVSLSNVSAENGTACYLTTDNTIKTFAAANTLKGMRAYFIIPSNDGAKETSLDFGDGKTTGIDAIDGGNALTESGSPKYNLAGQRVGNGYKGVVIVNGKKMIMK